MKKGNLTKKDFETDIESYLSELANITSTEIHDSAKQFLRNLHNGVYKDSIMITESGVANLMSYEELWAQGSSSIFPGILIASEYTGIYSYLLLKTGDVIAIHHDENSEFGYDKRFRSKAQFVRDLINRYSIGKIEQFASFCKTIGEKSVGELNKAPKDLIVESLLASYGFSKSAIIRNSQKRGFWMITRYLDYDYPEKYIQSYFLKKKKMPAIIEEAIQSKSLNLAGLNIEKLPEDFSKLHDLISLDLSENPNLDWADTFEQLKDCKKLLRLNLNDNELNEIPSIICELKDLRYVSFRGNEIKDDFDWESISHLETIDLNWCGISEDTKAIINEKLVDTQVWTGLYSPQPYEATLDKYHKGFKWKPGMDIPEETMYVVLDEGVSSFPKKDELPKSIRGMFMNFRETIDELPEYFCEIAQLESLKLNLSKDTDPDKFTEQLLKIKNLKQLQLDCNWDDLPDSFGKLKLESLYIYFSSAYNKKEWKKSSEVIGKMKSLVHLDLSRCWNMNHFQSFKELENLEWILIGNETNLNNLFSALKHLPKIKVINCNQKFFDKVSLPNDLGNIKSLESLELFRNPGFHKLPKTFTQLENLIYLDIRNNSFPKPTLDKILREMPKVNVLY